MPKITLKRADAIMIGSYLITHKTQLEDLSTKDLLIKIKEGTGLNPQPRALEKIRIELGWPPRHSKGTQRLRLHRVADRLEDMELRILRLEGIILKGELPL